MGILQRTHRRFIPFDPAQAAHRAAYWQLRTTGKQDEELRFELEAGFTNVLTMMQQKIADYFSAPRKLEAQNEVVSLGSRGADRGRRGS